MEQSHGINASDGIVKQKETSGFIFRSFLFIINLSFEQ